MEIEDVIGAIKRVLKRIPKSELDSITMPVLRGKVAVEMGTEEELLKTDEAKAAMMNTFQEFLLKGNEEEGSDSDDIIDEEPIWKKPKKSERTKDEAKAKPKTQIKAKTESKEDTQSSVEDSNVTKSKQKTASDAQIERLKSYIFKCGVRKVWKRELDGLNKKQTIDRLNEILEELGMDGRPTLEKCKEIKKKREFEAEMKEIDVSNIISEPRRRSKAAASKRAVIESDSEEEASEAESVVVDADSSESQSETETEEENSLNWKALGDPEDSE